MILRRVLLEAVSRYLQSGDGGSFDKQQSASGKNVGNSTSGGDSEDDEEEEGTYEFVAFLMWYLFLVLCCLIPTCFAYRRRRMIEARLAEQQASFDRLQESNLVILGNLHRQTGENNEEITHARATAIAEELQKTTMTVSEKDVETLGSKATQSLAGDSLPSEAPSKLKQADLSSGVVVGAASEGIDGSVHTAASSKGDGGSEDVDFAGILQLPNDESVENSNRTVPGTCAICLCPYEPGELVSWSPYTSCQHAFHKDCIVQWLSKKNQPNCPVCRQQYCAVTVSEAEEAEQQRLQRLRREQELILRFPRFDFADLMLPSMSPRASALDAAAVSTSGDRILAGIVAEHSMPFPVVMLSTRPRVSSSRRITAPPQLYLGTTTMIEPVESSRDIEAGNASYASDTSQSEITTQVNAEEVEYEEEQHEDA